MHPKTVLALASIGVFVTSAALIAFAQAQPTSGMSAAPANVPLAPTSRSNFVQVVDGITFTVLDANQGVTFRAASLRGGMTAEEAKAFERPGRQATPYVSITLLVEPGAAGQSEPLQFIDPSWGWPPEVQLDGSKATPARRFAFKSETLIPGASRPHTDEPFVVPDVSSKAELKTIRIYGAKLPEGPARFSVGLNRAKKTLGTLSFDNLPIR